MEDAAIKLLAWIFLILSSAMFGLLLAFPIMWCWNYVMPSIFHLSTITWSQSWCLNFLAGTLVKSALIDIKR